MLKADIGSDRTFPLQLPFSLELRTRRKGVEKARNCCEILDNSSTGLWNWFSPSSTSLEPGLTLEPAARVFQELLVPLSSLTLPRRLSHSAKASRHPMLLSSLLTRLNSANMWSGQLSILLTGPRGQQPGQQLTGAMACVWPGLSDWLCHDPY